MKNLILTGFVASVFIWSCNDDTSDLVNNEPNVSAEIIQFNQAKDIIASKVALNLATSLGEKKVREFIKTKSVEQFDGDYNFLVEFSKEEQISTSSSGRNSTMNFGTLISGNQVNSKGRAESNTFLDSIRTLYPLLQIAIPSLETDSAEGWDTENEIPYQLMTLKATIMN